MRRMSVLGVRVRETDPGHDVLVLLREQDGDRTLPIVIGPFEGVAIATAHAGKRSARPGPHELVLATLEVSGRSLRSVAVAALRDGTFYAELRLDDGNVVDARASDAIAVALRGGVEIWCAESVLDRAGVALDVAATSSGAVGSQIDDEAADADVARFAAFLDGVEPEDFAGPGTGTESPER